MKNTLPLNTIDGYYENIRTTKDNNGKIQTFMNFSETEELPTDMEDRIDFVGSIVSKYWN